MNITPVLLSLLLFTQSSQACGFDIPLTPQKIEKKHSLDDFKKFFDKHKNPTIEQVIKAFGQPDLSPLTIQDSIAHQQGEFTPTLKQAWWSYELKKEKLSIQIPVAKGKFTDVYISDKTKRTLTKMKL